MSRTRGRINEQSVNQNAQRTASDAISLGKNVLKVTVKNLLSSGATCFVSWNASNTQMNPLMPGESVTYWHDDLYLDGNDLYISFDANSSGGKALVSVLNDTDQPAKPC